jgi:hypothetical protein
MVPLGLSLEIPSTRAVQDLGPVVKLTENTLPEEEVIRIPRWTTDTAARVERGDHSHSKAVRGREEECPRGLAGRGVGTVHQGRPGS